MGWRARGPPRGWIRTRVATTALAAFLLLGASMGCERTSDGCDEAQRMGIEDEEEQDVYCDLVAVIESAEMDPDIRNDLLECLPEIAAIYRAELLERFLEADDQTLADMIESIAVSLECENYENGGWEDDDH